MANEVEITIRSTDKSADGIASAEKSVAKLGKATDDVTAKQRKGGDASKEYGKGLDSAGEAADKSETRIMGIRDTVDGTAAIMAGPGANGISAYLQGWADLAGGIAMAVIPALQAFSVTNMKATASAAASKTAMIATAAATKVWAAGQWLLNAALTANPIGLIVVGIAALIAGIVWAYRNVEGFRKVADAAFRAIGKAVGWLVDKAVAGFKLLWAGVEKVGGWFKKLTGGADDAADATDNTAESAKDAAAAYRDQVDAMDELTDRLLGLVDGELGLEDAIDKATASLKENGMTLDHGTEKGRNNERALNDIVRTTVQWRKAAADAGKSQDEQNRITEKGRSALIRAQIAMGASKDEARDYADQLLHIPAARSTKVTLRTSNLTQVRHNFDVVLRDRVVNVRVVTTGSSAIRDNDKRTGGIPGAASGGARGSRTLVGEDGPEIVDLPFGSMVRSAPDTARLLAGGGDPGRPLVIELKIGDRALGRLLIDPLRREIRTQGGDVQAVLGQGT